MGSFEFCVRSLGQVSAEYPRGSRFLRAAEDEVEGTLALVCGRRRTRRARRYSFARRPVQPTPRVSSQTRS